MDEHLLRVTVTEEAASLAELDNLTTSLRRTLHQTAVNDVTRAPADAPAGSKAGSAWDVSALVVNLLPSVLGSVVEAIRGWLPRDARRSVILSIGGDSIVVTQASTKEQEMLVNAWLSRHSEGVAQADTGTDPGAPGS
jgi:hypothetical protein